MTDLKVSAIDESYLRDPSNLRERWYSMSKRYELIWDKVPVSGGGFIRAVRMALVDMSCFGERHLDLAGYPHDSEQDALLSDWSALGADFREAVGKIESEIERQEGRETLATGGPENQQSTR